jgi:exodeoxyribonuclease VII large subunit
VELILIPAAVQGEGAPLSLCAALDRLEAWGGADLLIIGRGGGSREDLWAFNSEELARRLARCGIPTISAVGHEVDVSICDLIADWRAPTPSAAAERAVPVLDELRRMTHQVGERLREAGELPVIEARRQLNDIQRRCANAATYIVDRRRLEMNACAGKLEALSPLATMGRGYAVVTNGTGDVLSSSRALVPGDALMVRFRDGRVEGRVERVVATPDLAEGA